jgi:hypothetical protein
MAIPHPTQAKYLYSPRNELVCINTELKRKMCPWMVPCNKLDASDITSEPQVSMVYQGEYSSKVAEEQAAAANPPTDEAHTVEENYKVLVVQIMSSIDKTELCQIGADLGEDMSKSMKVENMRKRLIDKIDRLREAALTVPGQPVTDDSSEDDAEAK